MASCSGRGKQMDHIYRNINNTCVMRLIGSVGDRLKYGVAFLLLDIYILYVCWQWSRWIRNGVDGNDNIELTRTNHHTRGRKHNIPVAIHLIHEYVYTTTQVQHRDDEILARLAQPNPNPREKGSTIHACVLIQTLKSNECTYYEWKVWELCVSSEDITINCLVALSRSHYISVST